ncbi:MAG: FKBP-type peptidyl-prolyl cis-trans isomerase [Opitutae bacterium]|nr:FKBP-type peptidyl-prolyl cis-trans isomerase [Opitutae bacterium]
MISPRCLLFSGLALTLALAGCSKNSETAADREARKAGAYSLSAADQKVVAEKFPGALQTDTGLRYIVRAPGTGTTTPRYGAQVVANYDLRLLDGTPLESSVQSGKPLNFRVGMGNVIKGWDEAFLTMKKGERRTLIVPHWLGYGVTGSPPRIPPYATLVFEVELLDFH